MYSTEKISESISYHWFAKFTKSVAQIKVSKSCKNVADLWSRQAVKIILIAKGVKKMPHIYTDQSMIAWMERFLLKWWVQVRFLWGQTKDLEICYSQVSA